MVRDFRLHTDDESVRERLFDCHIGLEMESLRVNKYGYLAKTDHPFPDEKYIVRDFCENQTEINTPVASSVDEVMGELKKYRDYIIDTLAKMDEPEFLWPFSNPPYIRNEEDIPIARYEGDEKYKRDYRVYLSERYGRYKMTFSGIHFNYSFDESLLEENFRHYEGADYRDYRNKLYVSLAAKAQAYNWLVVALTAASPLLDSSYVEKGVFGQDVFNGMGTTRCSELGYWNFFTPILDYESISGYADSILKYIEKGLIRSSSELYFPVRLKSVGEYSLCALCEQGVSHIELRMIDLNPLAPDGLDVRDVKFIQLFLVWLASIPPIRFDTSEQVLAVQNTKNAARYDLKTVNIVLADGRSMRVTDAAEAVLKQMMEFYDGFGDEIRAILDFEMEKIIDADKRYAWQIREMFRGGFVENGLSFVKNR